MLGAPLHPNMLNIHLLSKSGKVLPIFFVYVCLISFALFGNFILSKGGRNESVLQEKNIHKKVHIVFTTIRHGFWFLCVPAPIYLNLNKSLISP